jgi:hypothetical protein
MAQAIIGEMQTPPNDDGVRLQFHPITESDAVVMKDGSTLTEAMNKETSSFTVSEEKPTGRGLWFKVQSVQENDN